MKPRERLDSCVLPASWLDCGYTLPILLEPPGKSSLLFNFQSSSLLLSALNLCRGDWPFGESKNCVQPVSFYSFGPKILLMESDKQLTVSQHQFQEEDSTVLVDPISSIDVNEVDGEFWLV